MRSDVLPVGQVEIIVEKLDGTVDDSIVQNTVVVTGRRALASCLAGNIGDRFNFAVTQMVFGDGGTVDGVKRYVNSNRNGLFGVTRIAKPVIASLDGTVPAQVTFTSVIRFDEGVGLTLNEMAIVMASGDLYSMTTFPDLNKTGEIQITFNWVLSFI